MPSMVNGILDQSYAPGWVQALRFDDASADTQWKAIAVNSNYSNILLYNITDDQSESVPLAGTPVGIGSDVTLRLDHPLRASPLVLKVLASATDLFQTMHVPSLCDTILVTAFQHYQPVF